jgi:hypothetical protein
MAHVTGIEVLTEHAIALLGLMIERKEATMRRAVNE